MAIMKILVSDPLAAEGLGWRERPFTLGAGDSPGVCRTGSGSAYPDSVTVKKLQRNGSFKTPRYGDFRISYRIDITPLM